MTWKEQADGLLTRFHAKPTALLSLRHWGRPMKAETLFRLNPDFPVIFDGCPVDGRCPECGGRLHAKSQSMELSFGGQFRVYWPQCEESDAADHGFGLASAWKQSPGVSFGTNYYTPSRSYWS